MTILDNKVAVITGGARGIGRDLAICFAENGATIVLIDIRDAEMGVTANTISKMKREVLCLKQDVRDKKQMIQSAEQVKETFGKVDILVTCAGIGQQVSSLEMSEEDWTNMINTNLSGTFYTCQAFGKMMCENKNGKVILIGSKSGLIVNYPATHAHYNVSKAGVIHLARCLASEWASFGVNVNCISPGYILTPMTQDRVEEHPAWVRKIPLGRLGLPKDIRGAALFLASEQSSFMTGANLVIDGGYTIW